MIKRNNIIFILALCFFYKMQCQVIYSKQDTINSWFSNIIGEKNSTNYLVNNSVPYFDSNENKNKFRQSVLKISSNGSFLGTPVFEPDFYTDINIVSTNNHYYYFGLNIIDDGAGNPTLKPTVIEYDLNFNKVKSVVLDSIHGWNAKAVKLIVKQNRIYAGYESHHNPFTFNLFKLDLNLNKMDSSMQNQGILYDLANYGDKLLMVGANLPQGSVNGNNQVVEMDTTFTVLNRFNLDNLELYYAGCIVAAWQGISGPSSRVIDLGNSKYFITGNTFVSDSDCNTKIMTLSSIISNNSSVIESSIIGKDSVHNHYSDASPPSSARYNYIYSTAQTGYDNLNFNQPQNKNTYLLVHKIDTSGNVVWIRYYGGDQYYLPLGIYATSDSGVVVCGIRYNHESPAIENIAEGFVMKITKKGEPELVGIRENGKLNTSYHKCYPNPSKDNIVFDIPLQQSVEICIYNTFGAEVLRVKDYQNLSALNISGFVPGTYAYKIKAKTGNYSGKFVKE